MASSVFTNGIEDDIASYRVTAAACMASYWLYCLGFTSVISALFSKIWMLGKVSCNGELCYSSYTGSEKISFLKILKFHVAVGMGSRVYRFSRNHEMSNGFRSRDRIF